MKTALTFIGGAGCGIVAGYLWLVWYFARGNGPYK